jgi:hypothetical protein
MSLPRMFQTKWCIEFMSDAAATITPELSARFVQESLPKAGLFAGQDWRISPVPFSLGPKLTKDFESLGRVLLQFYRSVNLLYRHSIEGKQPAWVAELLDQGKPAELIELQRSHGFKSDTPRVIRPDVLLTDDGFKVSELDSVPGGIGLTAWLNQTYTALAKNNPATAPVIGGRDGMLHGFAGIFGDAPKVHIVVSDESATYRPEMQWVADQLDNERFVVQPPGFATPGEGEAVYRFFELFDLANLSGAQTLFRLGEEKKIRLTPPPKPIFEEKLLFGLLWNRNLRAFWHQHLGESFLARMLQFVPYTWVVDPAPLPPHGAFPEMNLTNWEQLKHLSQRERDLILKVSGFSDRAWGARGVYLGSDLSVSEWSEAVDLAIECFPKSPYVLQRYHKPRLVDSQYFDFSKGQLVPMPGRARLCPYYFVHGEGDSARAELAGVLATICPADKKIIHGMTDAILAPCSV